MSERLGIDLGGTKVAGVRLAGDGSARWARRSTPKGDYAGTLAVIAEVLADLDADKALPVGVGTPGVANPVDGRMKNCNSTWLNGRTLLQDLNATLARPVRVANDADCFALAEARQGAAAQAQSAFGVILGTGVGGGVVLDGALLRGASGLAGEWGHTPLPYLRGDPLASAPDAAAEAGLPDRACYCGRLNCIETFLSGGGLTATHRVLTGREATAEAIAAAAAHAREASWDLYCRLLARSLAQVVNVIDPETIVLGGGLSKAPGLYGPVNQLLEQYVFGGTCAARVVPPMHGDAAGAIGAAWLWSSPDGGP